MALGHKPNRNCEWSQDYDTNEFEEYCINPKHARRTGSKNRSSGGVGSAVSFHYHYRCKLCHTPTDDEALYYGECPNAMCVLETVVRESLEELNETHP